MISEESVDKLARVPAQLVADHDIVMTYAVTLWLRRFVPVTGRRASASTVGMDPDIVRRLLAEEGTVVGSIQYQAAVPGDEREPVTTGRAPAAWTDRGRRDKVAVREALTSLVGHEIADLYMIHLDRAIDALG
jgi:hypothetical protein